MSDSDSPHPRGDTCESLVERWFVETFHGSVVARTTEIWNLVHVAKEDLKQKLAAFMAALDTDAPQD